tara:strand:+ start:157 stop:540 length:384 start_codon:yes stop_codon:yes gene_type:complete
MPEDTVPPADMEIPPAPRMLVLKIAVAVMGVLLVAGFGLVVATIVNRASNPSAVEARVIGPGGQFGINDVQITKGDVVRSVSLNEDRMSVLVSGVEGEEIIILNIKTGIELGRFRLRPLTGLAAAGK